MCIKLEGSSVHHLLRVMRIKPGAPLILFDGRGGEYEARVETIARHSASVQILSHHAVERESPLQITLLQGVARGDRMDFSIGKAVELGVSRIQPLLLDHSQGMDAQRLGRKLEHWRAVAQSAAEQCGRTRLPPLLEPLSLDAWLAAADGHDLKLALHPGAGCAMHRLPAPESLALLIGPEGGLSEQEVETVQAAGFQLLGLGPRILRTETAAIAAIGLCQAQWGDLHS